MYIFHFILSIIVFISFFSIFLFIRKRKVSSISIALGGTLIAIFILVFPLYQNVDLFLQLWQTFFFTIKTIAMGEDIVSLYSTLKTIFIFYRLLLYFYALIAPLFTATLLFYAIKSRLSLFLLKFKIKKDIHIFTEYNEKSFLLAKSLKTKNNIIIILHKEKNLEYYRLCKKEHILFITKNIHDLNLKKCLKNIYVYETSNNPNDNLNDVILLTQKYREILNNLTIYLFSNEELTRIIIDSLEKENINIVLINEIERIVYNLLDKKPLYEYAKDNLISVLIVGCGDIGKEFFKSITWCGQMLNYKLEIHIIDKKANLIASKNIHDYPELNPSNYNIYYHEADIFTKETDEILEKYCFNTNYIIVSLGNDKENIKAALNLRCHYYQKNKKPFISLVIKNIESEKEIKILKNEKNEAYQLYPFGSNNDLYANKAILNMDIEYLARQIHLHYNPLDKDLKIYNKLEYNKKASRALALHIKYKIYSILGTDASKEKFAKMLKNPKILNDLVLNEHDRWMAYTRSIGYKKASVEDVKNYMVITNSHINHIAKMHPCLIPYNDLDKLSLELSKIFKKKFDFKKSDFDVILAIPDILKKVNKN